LKFFISNNSCDYCHEKLTNWDYRYQGKHYCRKCYEILFPLKICKLCHQKKRIYTKLKTPICKICQQKDVPCIRCGKTEFSNGKITEFGPVCKSCAKYFTKKKKCSQCNQYNINVSNRKLLDGNIKLLCQKCYAITLPICSKCSYRRKPYCYTLDKKAICHICALEISRNCTLCGKSFTAGKGNICPECHYEHSLINKTNFIANALSKYTKKIFYDFSTWLSIRRGLLFASTHIQNYQAYFLAIDNLCEKLERIPTYKEIVEKFSVAKTRSNLLVTLFLNEKKIVLVDKKIQEEYANIDMINRYLESFKKETYHYRVIKEYYHKLYNKLENKRTTIRSIRLALTPAVKFLNYCENFTEFKPNMTMLNAYLWYYSGQKAAITGFINFLKKDFKLNLSIHKTDKIIFKNPNMSKEQLKQRLINLLRFDRRLKNNSKNLLKIAIGYLHGVDVPDNVFIDIKDIKIDSHKNYFIHMAGYNFYIPLEVVDQIRD